MSPCFSLMFIWHEVKIVPSLFYVTLKAQFIFLEAGLFSYTRVVVDEKEESRHMMPLLNLIYIIDFFRMNEYE